MEAAEDIAHYFASRKDKLWQIPVLTMEARKGEGVERLMTILDLHHKYMEGDVEGKSTKKEKTKQLVLALFKEEVWSSIMKTIQGKAAFEEIIQKVQDSKIDPYKAVRMALQLALPKE
jgi:putative protein kinase ArgK-like GTPase of G3E family